MKKQITQVFLAAAFIVPLQKEMWTEVKFSSLPANSVSFDEKGIHVDVNNSASPLIHKLKQSVKITGFEFQIKLDGILNPSPTSQFEEDSYFRLGLVTEGNNHLSGVKKLFAADWVKKLFALAPEGVGLDKIYFYNVNSENQILGNQRTHPKSDLMKEEIIYLRKSENSVIKFKKSLPENPKVVALWISIDGDNSKSVFKTSIEKIVLQTQD